MQEVQDSLEGQLEEAQVSLSESQQQLQIVLIQKTEVSKSNEELQERLDGVIASNEVIVNELRDLRLQNGGLVEELDLCRQRLDSQEN
tara:strand:+ start:309 stop:572 length:264 start_codon:yes stop_codon:yes gene_type:complete